MAWLRAFKTRLTYKLRFCSFPLLIIFIASCAQGSSTNSSDSTHPTGKIANMLTPHVDLAKACPETALTFCVNEKLTNNQAFQIVFHVNKGSVRFQQPTLSDADKIKGFTLSAENSTCSTTLSASAPLPCVLTLTYAPTSATPVDSNHKPIPQTLTLAYSYINNLGASVSLTHDISYEALSLLQAPVVVPSGVENLSKVTQSNVVGSTVLLLADQNLYSSLTPTTPIGHNILKYDLTQFSSGNIITQDSETLTHFYSLHNDGKITPLFSDGDYPIGAAIGKQSTFILSPDHITAWPADGSSPSKFVLAKHPIIEQSHIHFVDVSNNTDILYVYSTQSTDIYLTSVSPTGTELASSPIPIISNEDGLTSIAYSLAVNGKIFIVTNHMNIGNTLQAYVKNDEEKTITVRTGFTPYTTSDDIKFVPVYDTKHHLIYLVTSADNVHYTLHAVQSQTGKEIWGHTFSEAISTPYLTKLNNVIVMTKNGNIVGYEPTKGSLILTYPLGSGTLIGASSLESSTNLLHIPVSNGSESIIYSFSTNW